MANLVVLHSFESARAFTHGPQSTSNFIVSGRRSNQLVCPLVFNGYFLFCPQTTLKHDIFPRAPQGSKKLADISASFTLNDLSESKKLASCLNVRSLIL